MKDTNRKLGLIPIYCKKDILNSTKLDKAQKYIERKGYAADSIEDLELAIELGTCCRLLEINPNSGYPFICEDGNFFKYFLPKKKVKWCLPSLEATSFSSFEGVIVSSVKDSNIDSNRDSRDESKNLQETNEKGISDDLESLIMKSEIEFHDWCNLTASKLKEMSPQNLSQYIGHKAFMGDSLEDLEEAIKQRNLISLGDKELKKLFIPLDLAIANSHKVYKSIYRPFQTMDEFLQTVCNNDPDAWITMKRIDNGYSSTNLTVWHRRLQEYSETCNQVVFGVQHNFSFSEMFNKWKFLKNNTWIPFGIKEKVYLLKTLENIK